MITWCCAGSLTRLAKSRAKINGRPASVRPSCAELGATLLELHAQHEHQALLRSTTQQGSCWTALLMPVAFRAVQAAWRNARDAREALTHAKAPPMPSPAERAALETDLQDLRTARPNAEEWAALTQEQSRLSHSKELLQTVESRALPLPTDDGVAETWRRWRAPSGAERIDPTLGEARQLVESASVQKR